MDLLIAILICLKVYASPNMLNDQQFLNENQGSIEKAAIIINNNYYKVEGGVVIIDEVTV